MAALRYGVRTVIIPKANEKDLEEIDQTVRKSLNFITAEHVDQVLEAALHFPKQSREVTAEQAPQPPLQAEVGHTGRKPSLRQ